MTRITNSILERKVENINRKMNNQAGKGFCLEFAYGGVRLCKYVNEHGGLTDISERMSRPEMAKVLDAIYNTLYAFNLKSE